MTTADMPTQPVTNRPRISPAKVVRETTGAHINHLQYGYMHDRPDAVAAVARIRRGAGLPINAVPDLWGLTVTDALYAQLEQPEMKLRKGDLERAENAVHIGITLWALHQQSRRDVQMHVSGGPQLGRAVRALMPDGEVDEPIRRRFVRMGTASSLEVLTQRAREIVQLLRQHEQPMDYGMFADQLYRWQLPGGRMQVHQEWGRNFHANRPATTPNGESNTEKDAQ